MNKKVINTSRLEILEKRERKDFIKHLLKVLKYTCILNTGTRNLNWETFGIYKKLKFDLELL